mgnify:CR=1 FL=1
MKQLFLLRHGEAGFSQDSDFQRQLTIKGRQPGMMAIIELEIEDWKMIGFGTGILKEIIQ